jgi:hypothetical protein
MNETEIKDEVWNVLSVEQTKDGKTYYEKVGKMLLSKSGNGFDLKLGLTGRWYIVRPNTLIKDRTKLDQIPF